MLLLIDNYDSFTYNLFHYLGELGCQAQVRRNDEIDVQAAMAMNPAAILLSPGPCDPDRAGICLALIAAAAETRTPLIGVCLGHQAIGQAFGLQIDNGGGYALFNMHLHAGVANGGMAEWHMSSVNLERNTYRERFELTRDGKLELPDRPGLGFEIGNDDVLRRLRSA